MALRHLVIVLACATFTLPVTGCADAPDHYARALAVERELHRQAPDAGFEDHRYIVVLKELRKVPQGHRSRAQASVMEKRIRDGRRIAAAKKYPGAASLPARLTTTAPEAVAAAGPAAPPTAAEAPSADAGGELDIVLYSTAWCGYCKKARRWFTSNGIPFVEKDIEKDRTAHAEYRRIGRGHSGVPLISVNGAVIRGFDQRAVAKAIAQVQRGAKDPG